MGYDPDRHHRRSVRLRGYDYAQSGAYFVTLVTRHRECLLGDVRGGTMHENQIGAIARACWLAIPEHFPAATLGAFVVMPNHIHGIIVIERAVVPDRGRGVDVAGRRRGVQLNAPTQSNTTADQSSPSAISPRAGTLAVLVRTYKAAVTTVCRRDGYTGFAWQRNYYEHVIRTEEDLNRIGEYIINNPAQWATDKENPSRGEAGLVPGLERRSP